MKNGHRLRRTNIACQECMEQPISSPEYSSFYWIKKAESEEDLHKAARGSVSIVAFLLGLTIDVRLKFSKSPKMCSHFIGKGGTFLHQGLERIVLV